MEPSDSEDGPNKEVVIVTYSAGSNSDSIETADEVELPQDQQEYNEARMLRIPATTDRNCC